MESITYVAPIMQAFGGKATLSFIDLGVDESELPLDVVEPAAQRLLDPQKLRPFAKYRKQVHRACSAIGTRADGGGYLVPTAKIAVLASRLDAVEANWKESEADFIARFPADAEAWAAAHDSDGWGDKIRKALPSVATVHERFSFAIRYRAFGAPQGDASEHVGDGGLADEIGAIPFRVVSEVALDASETFKKGKNEAIAACIKRAIDKFDAWEWLDPKVATLRRSLAKFIGSVPADHKAWTDGDEFVARALLGMLSDPRRMIDEAARGDIKLPSAPVPVVVQPLFECMEESPSPVLLDTTPDAQEAMPISEVGQSKVIPLVRPAANPKKALPPVVPSIDLWAAAGW